MTLVSRRAAADDLLAGFGGVFSVIWAFVTRRKATESLIAVQGIRRFPITRELAEDVTWNTQGSVQIPWLEAASKIEMPPFPMDLPLREKPLEQATVTPVDLTKKRVITIEESHDGGQ